MRVLLIKTSSMGDVIHTLPALTDASQMIPGIEFDWIVEESFAEIPAWHPAVKRVIPVALRKWRKNVFARETRDGWRKLRAELKETKYDFILDAQGLAKSAFLGFLAQGLRVGLDFRSAREWPAALAYQKRCTVNFYQHAVIRMRSLFSQALDYSQPATAADFGIDRTKFINNTQQKYLVFLHATTWDSKMWPENYWVQLATIAALHGFNVKISGGNQQELERSQRIAKSVPTVEALPRQTIQQMASLLAGSAAAVAVDTGFGHLAGALNIPLVSLYGSTNPEYTGVMGMQAKNLAAKFPCSPCYKRECQYKGPSVEKPACYETLPPELVWQALGLN